MTWKLFLDDLRDLSYINADAQSNWIVCRTMEEAAYHIDHNGMPQMISFDHDLGCDEKGNELKSGYDLAKWIVERDLDGEIEIPRGFTFSVHSANPVGAKNISSILTNYLNSKGKY